MLITAITTYDVTIAQAMRRHLPEWDWRWLKGLLFQESRLDPNAVSPVGAEGIPQFMKPTWADMLVECPDLPSTATPFDPQYAIPAAAYYMAKLRKMWRTDRPEDDRRKLAQASYNAGFGNMTRAQTLAGGARSYDEIVKCLPDVTGVANAKQTTDYVKRIAGYYLQQISFDNVVAGVASTAPVVP